MRPQSPTIPNVAAANPGHHSTDEAAITLRHRMSARNPHAITLSTNRGGSGGRSPSGRAWGRTPKNTDEAAITLRTE